MSTSEGYAPSPASSSSSNGARYVRGHRFSPAESIAGGRAWASRCICGAYRCSSDAGELAEQLREHLDAHAFRDGGR